MKRLLTFSLIVIFLVIGCSSVTKKGEEPKATDKTKVSVQRDNLKDDKAIVPEWLYDAIKNKFQQPDLVKKDEITFFQVRMKQTHEPQIVAYLTLDRLNGVFVIFEKQGQEYKEVYEKREPVYETMVFGREIGQIVAFTSGLGGTGMQENNFHVVKFTSKGYKEVWKGIAEAYNFGGPFPWSRILGSINLDIGNKELVYGEIKRTYNKTDFDEEKPDKVETKVRVYKYNEKTDKFLEVQNGNIPE